MVRCQALLQHMHQQSAWCNMGEASDTFVNKDLSNETYFDYEEGSFQLSSQTSERKDKVIDADMNNNKMRFKNEMYKERRHRWN
jgi:hypothetical protein